MEKYDVKVRYIFDDVFSQFFDPVSEYRHGGFPASLPYGENLEVRMTTELPVRHFIVIPRCVDVAAQYQAAVFRHHAFRFFTVFRFRLDDERSKYDCSVRHVYGVDDSFFGDAVRIVS